MSRSVLCSDGGPRGLLCHDQDPAAGLRRRGIAGEREDGPNAGIDQEVRGVADQAQGDDEDGADDDGEDRDPRPAEEV